MLLELRLGLRRELRLVGGLGLGLRLGLELGRGEMTRRRGEKS